MRYQEVYNRWKEAPEAFWAEAAKSIDWYKLWDKVFDPYADQYGRWFSGALCNTCYNCLDRHVANGRNNQTALIYDSPITGSKQSFTYGELLDEELKRLASSELRSSSPKRWLRSYFTSGLRHYVALGRRPLPCDAGRGFFFMSPRGDVYPCNIRDEVMGNLRESDFEALWTSDQSKWVRAAIPAVLSAG